MSREFVVKDVILDSYAHIYDQVIYRGLGFHQIAEILKVQIEFGGPYGETVYITLTISPPVG